MIGLYDPPSIRGPVAQPEGSPWSGERHLGGDRYGDLAGFAALLADHPHLWLQDSQLKYLDIDVDTRSATFGLRDRDGNRVTAERVVEAIVRSRAQLGGAATIPHGGRTNSSRPLAPKDGERR